MRRVAGGKREGAGGGKKTSQQGGVGFARRNCFLLDIGVFRVFILPETRSGPPGR